MQYGQQRTCSAIFRVLLFLCPACLNRLLRDFSPLLGREFPSPSFTTFPRELDGIRILGFRQAKPPIFFPKVSHSRILTGKYFPIDSMLACKYYPDTRAG